jgi:type I restriction enzyme S subunit
MTGTEWTETTVGEVSEFVTGFPFASSAFATTGVRLIRGSNVKRGTIDWSPDIAKYWVKDDPSLRAFVLRDGDIVIAMDGALVGRSFARISEAELPAYLVQRVARLRGKSIDQNLLYQWISSRDFAKHVDDVKTHTAIPHISPRDIREFKISMPADTNEQRVMAAALGNADAMIVTLERLISKKQAIKVCMMQQLLTGRTRLPGFSGTWADIKLGDHVTYIKTVALSRAQLDLDSPLRYLHYGDIHTRDDVCLDASKEPMPRAASGLAGRAGRLQAGDLVFADASEDPDGVGKSVEITGVPLEGVVPGLHTIAARFDKAILADGFKAYLQCIPPFREQLLRLAAGTKVLATTRTYISSVRLSLPDVNEQRAIARALRDSEAEIAALRVRLEKARAIKTGMMQQLLTGRVRLPVEAAS